jgi:hypothetical protein
MYDMIKNICSFRVSFRGDKEIWNKFTSLVKNKDRKIWGELKPLLIKYIKEKE